MLNLLKAEFYKLKTSKTFYLIAALMVVQSILCPIFFSGSMTGKEVLQRVLEAQEFFSLIIVIGVFAACFIADEFTSGCIKSLISYGHRRRYIIISKSIVFYVGIIIISLIAPLLITIINTVMNGYGEVFTIDSLRFILMRVIPMLFIYIGISSIVLLAAFISRNTGITVGVGAFIDTINRLLRGFSFKNNTVKLIHDNTIFGQSLLMQGSNITFSQVLKVVMIAIVTIILSTLIAIYVFNKSDV